MHRPDGWYYHAPREHSETPIGIPKIGVVNDLVVVVPRSEGGEGQSCLGHDFLEVGTRDQGNVVASVPECPSYGNERVNVASAAEGG